MQNIQNKPTNGLNLAIKSTPDFQQYILNNVHLLLPAFKQHGLNIGFLALSGYVQDQQAKGSNQAEHGAYQDKAGALNGFCNEFELSIFSHLLLLSQKTTITQLSLEELCTPKVLYLFAYAKLLFLLSNNSPIYWLDDNAKKLLRFVLSDSFGVGLKLNTEDLKEFDICNL